MVDFNHGERDYPDAWVHGPLRPWERYEWFGEADSDSDFLRGFNRLAEDVADQLGLIGYRPSTTPLSIPFCRRYLTKPSDTLRERYAASLPEEIRAAFNTMIDTINEREKKGAYTYDAADTKKIKDALLMIWEHDIAMDPRIIRAENLFFRTRNTRNSDAFMDNASQAGEIHPDRLLATLEWMAKPENTDRVARMALYSRLVKNVPEEEGRTMIFVEFLHDRLKAGKAEEVTQRLTEDPNLYYREAVWSTQPLHYSQTVTRHVPLNNRQRNQPPISQAAALALAEAVPEIIEDHARLLDGSWARERANEVRAHIDETEAYFRQRAIARPTTGAGDQIVARAPSAGFTFG